MRSSFLLAAILLLSMPLECASLDDIDNALLRADALRLQGKYAQAEKMIRNSVRAIERMPQPNPARLAGAYNYFALVENNEGKYAESEAHARQAIAFAKQAGLEPAASAMHSVVLANALRQQGKYREAEALLVEVIPILRSTGSDQLLIGTAVNNLGAIYFWLGDFNKAMPLLQEGLRLRVAAKGENHIDVANSYLDLGAAEFKSGDATKAHEHVSKSAKIRHDALGDRHPETLAAQAVLAVILESAGEIGEASALLSNVVSNAKLALGANHPDLAQYEDSYANLLVDEKSFAKAKLLQGDSMNIRKRVFGEQSREYAASLRTLARIEQAERNMAKAQDALEKSAMIYKAAGQSPDSDYADTLDELATLYVQLGKLEDARKIFTSAADVRAQGGPSVSYAVTLANLADVSSRLNDTTASHAALSRAKSVVDSLTEAQRINPDCAAIIERFNRQSGVR